MAVILRGLRFSVRHTAQALLFIERPVKVLRGMEKLPRLIRPVDDQSLVRVLVCPASCEKDMPSDSGEISRARSSAGTGLIGGDLSELVSHGVSGKCRHSHCQLQQA